MWHCDSCGKDVPEPKVELVRDTTEYQGCEVFTGFVDEAKLCPDCGGRVWSTLPTAFIPDGELELIPL